MDPQTLSQTTVLYALSTLAQTCAALVAFLGAIAIYHLQDLSNRRHDALYTRIRDALITIEGSRVLAYSEANLLERAQAHIGTDDASTTSNRSELLEPFLAFNDIIPAQRMAERLFLYFLLGNVCIILAALICFLFVGFLAAHPYLSATLLAGAAIVIVVLTVAMALETVGSFWHWLYRLHLSRVLRFLCRPYQPGKDFPWPPVRP